MTPPRWPDVDGILFGADYNPEQWPESVWIEDIALMRAAGVNIVSLGIFSWALLEPSPGRYDFGWLDRVVALLHDGGIAIDMATATATPPPWFSRSHPQSLPQLADGTILWWGSRQAYCPSSPDYRDAATRLAGAMAERYAGHRAVRMWHINNEYGCHVAQCYCDTSAAAFREWLRTKYVRVEALNDAWATAFWSQRYGDWEEVLPPRVSPTWRNPTQQLDWWRFSSDALLDLFQAEKAAVRQHSDLPVTTNFMASHFKALDYMAWGGQQDLVSNDHYLLGADSAPEIELAFSADLTRGLARQQPWLLMESSTSAVNWQPHNLAKRRGQLRRNALQHLARGADGVLFFQWRASRGGAEKFHSGLVPHAGTDTKVWREVVALGQELAALGHLRGSRVRSRAALLWDYQAWWAVELDSHPSTEVRFLPAVRAYYDVLWRAGITVDVVHPDEDLAGYDLLLAPSLYLMRDSSAAAIADRVRAGASLVTSYFSGIVDDNDHIRLGGYPGALRELLGVRVEEFFPLPPAQVIQLSGGGKATVWTELLDTTGAEVVETYVDGPLPGVAAVTRHRVGTGSAWYLATSPDPGTLARVLLEAAQESGVAAPLELPAGVEQVQRGDLVFVLNDTDEDVTVRDTLVAAGDVVVLPAG